MLSVCPHKRKYLNSIDVKTFLASQLKIFHKTSLLLHSPKSHVFLFFPCVPSFQAASSRFLYCYLLVTIISHLFLVLLFKPRNLHDACIHSYFVLISVFVSPSQLPKMFPPSTLFPSLLLHCSVSAIACTLLLSSISIISIFRIVPARSFFFFLNFSAVDQVSKFFLLPRTSLFRNLSLCSPVASWYNVNRAVLHVSISSSVYFLSFPSLLLGPPCAARFALLFLLLFDISIVAFSLVKDETVGRCLCFRPQVK